MGTTTGQVYIIFLKVFLDIISIISYMVKRWTLRYKTSQRDDLESSHGSNTGIQHIRATCTMAVANGSQCRDLCPAEKSVENSSNVILSEGHNKSKHCEGCRLPWHALCELDGPTADIRDYVPCTDVQVKRQGVFIVNMESGHLNTKKSDTFPKCEPEEMNIFEDIITLGGKSCTGTPTLIDPEIAVGDISPEKSRIKSYEIGQSIPLLSTAFPPIKSAVPLLIIHSLDKPEPEPAPVKPEDMPSGLKQCVTTLSDETKNSRKVRGGSAEVMNISKDIITLHGKSCTGTTLVDPEIAVGDISPEKSRLKSYEIGQSVPLLSTTFPPIKSDVPLLIIHSLDKLEPAPVKPEDMPSGLKQCVTTLSDETKNSQKVTGGSAEVMNISKDIITLDGKSCASTPTLVDPEIAVGDISPEKSCLKSYEIGQRDPLATTVSLPKGGVLNIDNSGAMKYPSVIITSRSRHGSLDDMETTRKLPDVPSLISKQETMDITMNTLKENMKDEEDTVFINGNCPVDSQAEEKQFLEIEGALSDQCGSDTPLHPSTESGNCNPDNRSTDTKAKTSRAAQLELQVSSSEDRSHGTTSSNTSTDVIRRRAILDKIAQTQRSALAAFCSEVNKEVTPNRSDRYTEAKTQDDFGKSYTNCIPSSNVESKHVNDIPEHLTDTVTSGQLTYSDPGLMDEDVPPPKNDVPSQVPTWEYDDLVENGTERILDESKYMEISSDACNDSKITFSQLSLKTKRCRFLTFGGKVWTCVTPTVEELVHTGFFYRGYGTCTECFSCGIMVDWHNDDVPVEQHLKHNKECSFIRKVSSLKIKFISPIIDEAINELNSVGLYDMTTIEIAVERLDCKDVFFSSPAELIDEISQMAAEGQKADCAANQLSNTAGATCKELTQEITRNEWLRIIGCRRGEVERIDKGACRPLERHGASLEQTQEEENVIQAISQRDVIAEPDRALQTELTTTPSEINSLLSNDSLYSTIENSHLPPAIVGEKEPDLDLRTTNLVSAIENQASEEEEEVDTYIGGSLPLQSDLNDVVVFSDSPTGSPECSVGSAEDTIVRHNRLRQDSALSGSELGACADFSSDSESDDDVTLDEAISSETELADSDPTPSSKSIQWKEDKTAFQDFLVSLREENQQLRVWSACKVCFINQVSVLYLDCLHLVCCFSCSEKLNACPVCRKYILNTMNVYLL